MADNRVPGEGRMRSKYGLVYKVVHKPDGFVSCSKYYKSDVHVSRLSIRNVARDEHLRPRSPTFGHRVFPLPSSPFSWERWLRGVAPELEKRPSPTTSSEITWVDRVPFTIALTIAISLDPRFPRPFPPFNTDSLTHLSLNLDQISRHFSLHSNQFLFEIGKINKISR